MRYRFAFGLGRRVTTLLGRLLGLTSAPARFVSELCPGIGDRISNPAFMVEPGDIGAANRVREAIIGLSFGESPFCEAQAYRIERNDPDAEVAFEDLCRQPRVETLRVFDFLGFDHVGSRDRRRLASFLGHD